DSLAVQEPPIEVIVVDSHSEDATRDIVRTYEKRYDFVHLYVSGGTRGAGRNFGIRKARGEAVAFIDGDAIANPFWIRELREGLRLHDIVAGRTIQIGYRPFEELERVELIVQGTDVTYPSSNLAYRKAVLDEIGGFDEWFVTAEDIDLNIRAVRAGHPIVFRADAIVYHRTRDSVYDFLRQALWNGAGRKQLTLRHGAVWSRYRPGVQDRIAGRERDVRRDARRGPNVPRVPIPGLPGGARGKPRRLRVRKPTLDPLRRRHDGHAPSRQRDPQRRLSNPL